MRSYRELSADLREALTQFLWDQWVSIGVAGSATQGDIPFMVDPEVLFLATTAFAGDETRLLGEIADWLKLNGKSISIQRLKNFHRDLPVGDWEMVFDFAETMVASGHPSWKSLLNLRDSRVSAVREATSGTWTTRGMSQRSDPHQVSNFMFRMRSFFGMNARAEVFAWLLTHDSGHPAGIARETGWFSKTVQVILNELEQSGLVLARTGDREKVFRLQSEQWRHLLPRGQKPVWFAQAPFYTGCADLHRILLTLADSEEGSDSFRATVIRPGLPRLIASFEKAGLSRCFSGLSRLKGTDLVSGFHGGTEILLKFLGDRGQFSPSLTG
ncbi:MAG: hypothetical protein KDL87_04120 [Verrucomicrobiae bacterium]|nr:hypothetical protein [Verrucomicrobiae bacterium]